MSETRRGGGSVADAWIGKAMLLGFVAGLVFIVFEVAVATVVGASPLDSLGPLKMIGAILLGQGALQEVSSPLPEFGKGLLLRLGNPLSVAGVGVLMHLLLSAFYGGTFGVATWLLRPLSRSRVALVASATTFGILLWLVNFYVISPFAFPWFTMANPIVQFLAHAFFFGTILGLLLAWMAGTTQSRETENHDGDRETAGHDERSNQSPEPRAASHSEGDQNHG